MSQHVLTGLYAADLRSASICCRQSLQALLAAPEIVRWQARNLVCWHSFGGGARADDGDPAVVVGGGGWHPGGVATAALHLSSVSRAAFRFEVERVSRIGDLLLGLTRIRSRLSDNQLQEALDMGYHFIMGRELAPASIFYGGRSLRCCFSHGDGKGPALDYGLPSGPQTDFRMSRLCKKGDWVEFHLTDGVVRATDFSGRTFQWFSRMGADEIWQPTVAWTGSTASIRIFRVG